jgi:hypothetical protein
MFGLKVQQGISLCPFRKAGNEVLSGFGRPQKSDSIGEATPPPPGDLSVVVRAMPMVVAHHGVPTVG